MIKAVVFDIDGTLASEVSWLSLTRDLGASAQNHKNIHEQHKSGILSYEEAKYKVIELWRATGRANKPAFEEIFNRWPLKKDAEEIVDYLYSKNYILCLITGSLDLYAKIVAERLGIRNFFANTELVWDSSNRLIDLRYELKQGEKKLSQFLAFCKDQHLVPQECVVVGDDENDIPLFSLTGNGVAVESPTSHHLEKVAWKRIFHLSELKDIL